MTLTAHLARGGLGLDVPVEPDAGTARQWAVEELSAPIYNERPSVLQMLLDWILEQFQQVQTATGAVDPARAALIVGGVVLVVALIVLLVAGPVRRARTARRSVEVFGDDTRTADELRTSADGLAAQGRFADAVLDRFRAIMRSLEDRALLDDLPGRTAHEAAERSADRLPACAEDLRAAGRLFDDVCYGHADATVDHDSWLREVDRRVADARPAVRSPEPVAAS